MGTSSHSRIILISVWRSSCFIPLTQPLTATSSNPFDPESAEKSKEEEEGLRDIEEEDGNTRDGGGGLGR